MTDPVSATDARRSRRMLYLLMLVFFGPLLLSVGLYYGSDWRPVSQANHGELIDPARPLPEGVAALRGEWSIVHIADGACESEACRTALVFARQTRLGLNKDMTRVQRVLLATGNCCGSDYLAREHEGLIIEDATAQPGLLDVFPAADREHSLYVVDPLGNLVMRYDVREDPKGFLTDLRKLLRLSHIG
jgi:hypothetical protein